MIKKNKNKNTVMQSMLQARHTLAEGLTNQRGNVYVQKGKVREIFASKNGIFSLVFNENYKVFRDVNQNAATYY